VYLLLFSPFLMLWLILWFAKYNEYVFNENLQNELKEIWNQTACQSLARKYTGKIHWEYLGLKQFPLCNINIEYGNWVYDSISYNLDDNIIVWECIKCIK